MGTLGSVVDLLAHRHPGTVEVLIGPADRRVSEVRLVEQVDQVDDAPAGALLVLERGLAALTGDYRFDVMVRRAAAREVAALVVVLPEGAKLSLTAMALARRAEIAVIRLAPEVDVTAALGTMVRQATDRLSVTVGRARAVCEAIDGRSFDSVEALLDRVGLLLGRTVSIGPRPDGDGQALTVPAGPINGTDRSGGWLWTERPGDADADALLEMVLWRVAAETTRLTDERVRAEQVSRRSAGEVLVQLVEADRAARAAIAPSARRLGIPVDGWHVVTRIEPDNLLEVVGDDVAAFETRDELASLALKAAASMPGTWHVGHEPAGVLLLWTGDSPPRQETHAQLQRQLAFVLKALVGRVRGLQVFCGTGTARPGIAGLASSATEARLAVSSARFRQRYNVPVHFDAVGMRATLLEWYGSPTVQQSIDRLFAPLADLTPAKRQAMIDTVCTYLDLQGSAARTAEVLHLHRNAVRYRIQRAFEVLGIDEHDADQRLFLHLACRAQRLGDIGA
ncbi:helix-turn-helix domain-containing protein [Pseudonocardia aurantiaca]|uniref:PucR family transcriptional regulator n=1 Tax=Pseudonocardia aurantiaca TaxID=75290 RepID=A0ABW4FIP9_9PSEU